MKTFKQLQEDIQSRQDIEEGWIKDTYEFVKKHKKKLATAGLVAAIGAGTVPTDTLKDYPHVQKIHAKLRGLASVAGDVSDNLPHDDSSHLAPVSSSNRNTPETPEEVSDRRRKKLVKRSKTDPLLYNRDA